MEIYIDKGGEPVLGPAISPVIKEGSVTRQYFLGGELVFDPNAKRAFTFSLAPIGVEMGIREPAVPPPTQPDLTYVGGQVIFPPFLPMIQKLGGTHWAQWTGNPLTEPRFNLIRNRYEQYFENVGFYMPAGSQKVGLLAYGPWICKDECSTMSQTSQNAVDIQGYIDPTFQPFVTKLGADFTGFALTDAYGASDGKWEVVLENMVLAAEQRSNPDSISLRPLTGLLDIQPESPLPYSGDSNMYFYATDGDKGYEIPVYFWDYLEKHGGIKVSGPPITHYSLLQAQMYHQCFENLCLVYDLTLNPEARIRPEPLGYAYQVKFPTPQMVPTSAVTQPPASQAPTTTAAPVTQASPAQTGAPAQPPAATLTAAPQVAPTHAVLTQAAPTEVIPTQAAPTEVIPTQAAVPTAPVAASQTGTSEIVLQVWAQFAVVETMQSQQIGIWVTEDGHPLENTRPELVVRLPDGTMQHYAMPPTNAGGQSSLLLPELNGENGTVYPYKVCIPATDTLRVCGAGFFVTWNNP